VAITYTDGILTQAITRGDGLTGDDVTTNVMQIANIPHRLTGEHIGEIIVRGEIIMPISVWKSINTEREAAGEPVFANPRNAAAGTIKLLDAQEVKKRGLVGYMYDVLVCSQYCSPCKGGIKGGS
jgi:DNA ligase (NAD+)